MPFPRPTLTEIRAGFAADVDAALPGVDALLRYSNLGILSAALANAVDGLYGYLDWVARQSVPFTATDEYLEGWAALKGVTRKPATNAIGSGAFTGTNGTIIPAGTSFTRLDGFSYFSTADVTVASGSATPPLVAALAGADGNADDGMTLNLASPIAGVATVGAVSGAITGGADIETDSELQSRMLAAYANPPQGGAIDDYAEWALDVAGVTRVWVAPSAMGPGSVVIYFMMDNAEAAHGGFPQGTNGCATLETRDTPATGDQLALADALFFQQPVTALVYAVAPSANTINLTIEGLSSASDTTKSSVEGAFSAALLVAARPGGVTPVSEIESAIASVALTTGFVITTITASHGTVSPGSAGNITSDAGYLPVPGTVTFT